MILRHYFDFGNRSNIEMNGEMDWEYLRQDSSNPAFCLETSRDSWLENCRRSATSEKHAQYICLKLDEMIKDSLYNKNRLLGQSEGNITLRLCALGAGKGILEWHIKKLRENVYICCTDYAETAVKKLSSMFDECDECRPFDMLGGSEEYELLKSFDAVEMYRISTEFDKTTWKEIFKKIADTGVERIIFVPTELAGFKDVAREAYMRLKFSLRREKPVFAGWLYSKEEFEDIFSEHWVISDMKRFENTAVFTLDRKRLI